MTPAEVTRYETHVHDDASALAAEVRRLQAAQTWQPIATAPKDGTEVLLHGPEGIDIGEWQEEIEDVCESGVIVEIGFDAGFFGRVYAAGCNEPPTHWQPLPAPPQEQP